MQICPICGTSVEESATECPICSAQLNGINAVASLLQPEEKDDPLAAEQPTLAENALDSLKEKQAQLPHTLELSAEDILAELHQKREASQQTTPSEEVQAPALEQPAEEEPAPVSEMTEQPTVEAESALESTESEALLDDSAVEEITQTILLETSSLTEALPTEESASPVEEATVEEPASPVPEEIPTPLDDRISFRQRWQELSDRRHELKQMRQEKAASAQEEKIHAKEEQTDDLLPSAGSRRLLAGLLVVLSLIAVFSVVRFIIQPLIRSQQQEETAREDAYLDYLCTTWMSTPFTFTGEEHPSRELLILRPDYTYLVEIWTSSSDREAFDRDLWSVTEEIKGTFALEPEKASLRITYTDENGEERTYRRFIRQLDNETLVLREYYDEDLHDYYDVTFEKYHK